MRRFPGQLLEPGAHRLEWDALPVLQVALPAPLILGILRGGPLLLVGMAAEDRLRQLVERPSGLRCQYGQPGSQRRVDMDYVILGIARNLLYHSIFSLSNQSLGTGKPSPGPAGPDPRWHPALNRRADLPAAGPRRQHSHDSAM